MASLLIRDLDTVVTCDDADSVLRHVDLYCEDGRIRAIGPDLAVQADEVLDGSHLLCYFVPMSALLVLAARESLRFSGYFTAYGFRNEPEEQMYHQLRMYCARFVVLAVFLLLFGFAYGTAF